MINNSQNHAGACLQVKLLLRLLAVAHIVCNSSINSRVNAFHLVILLYDRAFAINNYIQFKPLTAFLQNLRILDIIMIVSVAMNQLKLLGLLSNQMHLSFVWLQHSRLAWHDPLNSILRPNSITEHLTLRPSTRLRYFTTRRKISFKHMMYKQQCKYCYF